MLFLFKFEDEIWGIFCSAFLLPQHLNISVSKMLPGRNTYIFSPIWMNMSLNLSNPVSSLNIFLHCTRPYFSEDYENKDNEDNETYEDFYILMQIMSDYPQ